MSPAEILTAFAAVIAAVGVIVSNVLSYRAREKAAIAAVAARDARTEVQIVHGEVREVGQRIDGRLTELLRVSEAAARAEGVAAGEQSERDRRSGPSV